MADLVRGVLVLLIPLLMVYFKSMVPVYIVVFIMFSMTRFFLPSKLAIIPDIVQKDKLLLANSLTSTTRMIATVVGFGLGGLIVAQLGAKGGFYVDSVTYFISALMVSFVAIKFKAGPKVFMAKEKLKFIIRRTILEDIKEGFLYLKSHKDIRMIANTMFLIMAGVGSIYIIIIVFVQDTLHSSTEHLGFLAMFLGIGLLLGSLVYGRFGGRFCKRRVINFGLCLTGLAIVLFAVGLKLWPYFSVAAALSMLIGILASPIIVSSSTLLHEVMEEKMRGRVFSSMDIIMHIAFLLFMVFVSLIAEWVRRELVLVIVGTVFSAIGFVKLVRSRAPKA